MNTIFAGPTPSISVKIWLITLGFANNKTVQNISTREQPISRGSYAYRSYQIKPDQITGQITGQITEQIVFMGLHQNLVDHPGIHQNKAARKSVQPDQTRPDHRTDHPTDHPTDHWTDRVHRSVSSLQASTGLNLEDLNYLLMYLKQLITLLRFTTRAERNERKLEESFKCHQASRKGGRRSALYRGGYIVRTSRI